MRRLSAMVLISAFLLHSVIMLVTVFHFCIFRAEITSRYCVNLNNGDLDCRGCCHLAKKLQILTNEKTSIPLSENTNSKVDFEWNHSGIIRENHIKRNADVLMQYSVKWNYFGPVISIEEPPPRC